LEKFPISYYTSQLLKTIVLTLEMEGRTHMKILIKEEDKGGWHIIVPNIKLGYINKHFDMVFHIFCLQISVIYVFPKN